MKFLLKSLALAPIFALVALSVAPTPAQAKSQCGQASFYGLDDGYQGGLTASGTRFNTWSTQAAHPTLPFGTPVTVRAGNKTTKVTITDRGPYAGGRIIDLSAHSFGQLAPRSRGVIPVCIYW